MEVFNPQTCLGSLREVFTHGSLLPFFFWASEMPPSRFSTQKLALGASERFSPMDIYSFFFFLLGGVGKYGAYHHIHLSAYWNYELCLWQRLLVNFKSVTINKKGDSFLIYGSNLNYAIIKTFFHFVRSQPSCHHFSFEIFKPWIIQQHPISFLEGLLFDVLFMPYLRLQLNYFRVKKWLHSKLIQSI